MHNHLVLGVCKSPRVFVSSYRLVPRKPGLDRQGKGLYAAGGGVFMAEWITIAILLSPLAIKVIQLKKLQVGGDGILLMEFESFFRVRSETKPIPKNLRRQVKH